MKLKGLLQSIFNRGSRKPVKLDYSAQGIKQEQNLASFLENIGAEKAAADAAQTVAVMEALHRADPTGKKFTPR